MTEQRKLIRLGNSSFALALPKSWVDKSGLKKGDKVSITPDANGGLTIGADVNELDKNKEVFLDLKEKEGKHLEISLIGAYLKDNNIISIKNNLSAEKKKNVKNLIKNLMSFEIIEENNEEIKARDMFNIKEADPKNFIRRMDNIVRSFFEDLEQILIEGKSSKKISEEMYEADKEVTRLHLLISRIFMKSLGNPSMLHALGLNYNEIFNDWWIAKHIESIGDGIKFITRKSEVMFEEKDQILLVLKKLKENYISCMNAYYKREEKLVEIVISNSKKLLEECDKIEDAEMKGLIRENLKKIQIDIFEIARMLVYSLV